MRPNYQESVRFLRWLYPEGPWLLVAFPFNRLPPYPTIRTYADADVLAWCEKNDALNMYYQVNATKDGHSKKASKEDVTFAHFLQVDTDLRVENGVAEDPVSGRARIIKKFESYPIRPSALIFSGGGCNALWRLSTPKKIDGESDWEDVEAVNMQLSADLEGDATHDVSRILRLPGTVNRLNETKTAKGRVPGLSEVIWLESTTYDLSRFVRAPRAPRNQPTSTARVANKVERVESLEQLQIPPKLRVVIAQGHDPDVQFDGDRSGQLFKVCCEMVRLKIPDEVILGVITDSRFGISASVLDKGARMQRYALRQIQRAKEKAFDSDLLRMNDRHAVIRDHGGKCMVMIEEESGRMRFQRPRDFFDGYDNEKKLIEIPEKKPKLVGIGSWWFDQRMRRQYERVVFKPGVEIPGELNVWQGFATEPRAGDLHKRYLDHAFRNICRGIQERYDYLISWMARVVQQPATQSMSAVILLGDRGTGKSILGKTFAKIFGQHAFVAKTALELTGRFNEHLRQCVFLLSEEAWDFGDRRHDNVLKEMITSEVIATEAKGLNIVQSNNYTHVMMTSNDERVIAAGKKERRYFVMRVKERTDDEAFFLKILDEMGRGGLENLLHHLMSIDLSSFNVTAVPKTAELEEQQDHSLAPEEDWLWSKLEEGQWLTSMRVRWEGPVVKETLHREYLQTMTSLNVRRPMSLRQFGLWIKRVLPDVMDKQLSPQKDHSRPWCFVFRPLRECREFFAKLHGREVKWAEIGVDEYEPGKSSQEVFS